MSQIPWFHRKFNFDFNQNIMPSLIERLAGTPIRIKQKVQRKPRVELINKPDGNWSIMEHLGHLSDLEPIWQGRLQDILDGKTFLRDADLSNTKTHKADHNSYAVEDLLERFYLLREETVELLHTLEEDQIFKSALHPRLRIPMNCLALCSFVADHDDHHLSFMKVSFKK